MHEHLLQAASSLASLAQALAAAIKSPSESGAAGRATIAAPNAEGVGPPVTP